MFENLVDPCATGRIGQTQCDPHALAEDCAARESSWAKTITSANDVLVATRIRALAAHSLTIWQSLAAFSDFAGNAAGNLLTTLQSVRTTSTTLTTRQRWTICCWA